MKDPRLTRIVQRCQALPGEDLFQYLDDQGVRQAIGSGDVNDHLRAVSGEEFTAKDFRQQTRAVCRKHYVHPAVLDAYTRGTLLETIQNGTGKAALEIDDAAVAGLLRTAV